MPWRLRERLVLMFITRERRNFWYVSRLWSCFLFQSHTLSLSSSVSWSKLKQTARGVRPTHTICGSGNFQCDFPNARFAFLDVFLTKLAGKTRYTINSINSASNFQSTAIHLYICLYGTTRLESHACQVTGGGCVLSSRDSMTVGANSLSKQISALGSHHSF